jgi:hypothetical protein
VQGNRVVLLKTSCFLYNVNAYVDPTGIDMDKDIEYWIQLCVDHNGKAKASKKK